MGMCWFTLALKKEIVVVFSSCPQLCDIQTKPEFDNKGYLKPCQPLVGYHNGSPAS